ncbi:MAG: hypothetical protein KAX73_07500 [Aquabacterium sp.]|nr:hypothetical protein [Aquabacterium sp.]
MTTYVMKVLIAVDQLANAVRGGHPDETLSAAAHRRHLEGRSGWRNLINALFFWQGDHCLDAHQSELSRKQLPKEYR